MSASRVTTGQLEHAACEICGNALGNKSHLAREMMFGSRDEFCYLECNSCGCLQNVSVPDDMERYYGSAYYSVGFESRESRPIYDFLKGWRTRAFLEGNGKLRQWVLGKFGKPGLPAWVKLSGMRQNSSILEVGCGSGELLRAMQSEGFTNLTGLDPFIEKEIDHGEGLLIRKAEIAELTGPYDYIVLEHAFEHIPNQRDTLNLLMSLLAERGVLIVAIPLVSHAWHRYGVDWVQLDAPRHLYLHTERSFRLLCRDVHVAKVVYDSGAMQFWGSEQYARGISLLDPRSMQVNPRSDLFSKAEMDNFAALAATLNIRGDGDQATFYLTRSPDPATTQ